MFNYDFQLFPMIAHHETTNKLQKRYVTGSYQIPLNSGRLILKDAFDRGQFVFDAKQDAGCGWPIFHASLGIQDKIVLFLRRDSAEFVRSLCDCPTANQ